MADFGWDLPPGVSNSDFDTGCDHENVSWINTDSRTISRTTPSWVLEAEAKCEDCGAIGTFSKEVGFDTVLDWEDIMWEEPSHEEPEYEHEPEEELGEKKKTKEDKKEKKCTRAGHCLESLGIENEQGK